MTRTYRLVGIDPEQWMDFKAFAALQDKTVKELLLSFIEKEVAIFREVKGNQGTIHEMIAKFKETA